MKFPNAVLKQAVENIDVCISKIDDFDCFGEEVECVEFHRSSNIGNIKQFIKKIAKYLGATIIDLDDYSPIILSRDDSIKLSIGCVLSRIVFIRIDYVLIGNEYIMSASVSHERDNLC